MTQRTTLADRIEQRMLYTAHPLAVATLVHEFQTQTKCVTNAMVDLRKKYGSNLVRSKLFDHTAYSIVGGPVPKTDDAVFPLPDDLWRGWVNPLTGIQPKKLGL